MTKRTRRKFPLIVVLVLLAAFAVFWRALPKNGLLDHAVPLVTRDNWMGPERRNGEIGNYVWLSNDEILRFQRNPDKTVALMRQKVLPPGKVGAMTPLPVAPLVAPDGVYVSPDRSSLHALYYRRSATRSLRLASEFVSLRDGRSSGLIPGWLLGTWYEGTHRLCECEYEKDKRLTAVLHDYDMHKDEEIVVHGLTGAPLMVGNVWPLFVESSGRVVAMSDSYYDGIVTPADKVRLGSKLSPVHTFVEFNLKDPDRKGKVWTAPVPKDAASFQCIVSPGHDRLFWIVQSNRMPFLATMTQKLPKLFKQPNRYVCRWMVSDLDGRNMRTLAEFEISDLHYNRPDLISPQWTLDGKHVSFEYQSALYLMNVD